MKTYLQYIKESANDKLIDICNYLINNCEKIKFQYIFNADEYLNTKFDPLFIFIEPGFEYRLELDWVNSKILLRKWKTKNPFIHKNNYKFLFKADYISDTYFNYISSVICTYILHDLDQYFEKIKSVIDEINELNIKRYSIPSYKVPIQVLYMVKNDLEGHIQYQKYLLDKGLITDLMKIKELKPEIKEKMKDAIKQTEWS